MPTTTKYLLAEAAVMFIAVWIVAWATRHPSGESVAGTAIDYSSIDRRIATMQQRCTDRDTLDHATVSPGSVMKVCIRDKAYSANDEIIIMVSDTLAHPMAGAFNAEVDMYVVADERAGIDSLVVAVSRKEPNDDVSTVISIPPGLMSSIVVDADGYYGRTNITVDRLEGRTLDIKCDHELTLSRCRIGSLSLRGGNSWLSPRLDLDSTHIGTLVALRGVEMTGSGGADRTVVAPDKDATVNGGSVSKEYVVVPVGNEVTVSATYDNVISLRPLENEAEQP